MISGYDQWKTQSPYDDYDDTHCPRCGEVLNNIEYEGNEKWMDDGFCSKECMDEFETDSNYDGIDVPRSKRLTREQRKRLREMRNQARSVYYLGYDKEPSFTVDDIFANAPEGDFKWDDMEAGDWHVYHCGEKDCPIGWHRVAYYEEFGRKDGKRYILLGSVDYDGNSEIDEGWEEGEDFSWIAKSMENKLNEYFWGWFQYWHEAAITGKDVLGECTLDNPTPADFVRFAEDNYKYLCDKPDNSADKAR